MRRPRLEMPGIPLHITHRGVNRGATFIDDEDCAADVPPKKGSEKISV